MQTNSYRQTTLLQRTMHEWALVAAESFALSAHPCIWYSFRGSKSKVFEPNYKMCDIVLDGRNHYDNAVLYILSLHLFHKIDFIGLTPLSRKTSTTEMETSEMEVVTLNSMMTTGSHENTTTYVYDHTQVMTNFILASIIGVCGFFGILGNSLVVITWAMSRKLQTITNIFIVRCVS